MYARESSYLFYVLLNTIWCFVIDDITVLRSVGHFVNYKRRGKTIVILLKCIRICVMFNVIVSTGRLKTYYDNNVILSSTNQNI